MTAHQIWHGDDPPMPALEDMRDDSDASELPPPDDEWHELESDRCEQSMAALWRAYCAGASLSDCQLLAIEMRRSDDWEDYQAMMADSRRDYF